MFMLGKKQKQRNDFTVECYEISLVNCLYEVIRQHFIRQSVASKFTRK